ncbi:hypothetical protein RJ55_06929 [Drechmeria coniospora]|nr:hypothetical protein RJ55_06929 [Drechmeria coniospora]
MFKRSKGTTNAGQVHAHYPLDSPPDQRWNPLYNVPRNSLEHASPRPSTSPSTDEVDSSSSPKLPTQAAETQTPPGKKTAHVADKKTAHVAFQEAAEPGLSSLSHWLETLAELYMNKLDNRARWDPRWLSVTHRERYEGLASVSISVLDYVEGGSTPTRADVDDKRALATALQSRPDGVELRLVLVSDLSRFVMGALGQVYDIDAEFWFEHLANGGYAASDSQLKVSNAVWMNWAEQETRFRHRAVPGTGQRTEWNVPRRIRGRCWAHLRWPRLGLLHYLGRKGFHEDEIERRLDDGRWMVERDVVLDKHGLLMTKKRLARAKRSEEKRRSKGAQTAAEETTARVKATNVYRAYSTFEGLPKNVTAWFNRDLRVLAPEGASYWSGRDAEGRRTVVLLLDPARSMRHGATDERTPSLTFMPRAMEIESYSDEELWRGAGPEETYLDPPPPAVSKAELKRQKKEAIKRRIRDRKSRAAGGHDASGREESAVDDDGLTSEYTSDDEYDEEYERELRAEYRNPKAHARDRDFARKYSLTTHELVVRHVSTLATSELAGGDEAVAAVLGRLVLDDFWQLLAEMRLELDHLDNDLSAGLHEQLVESIGNSTRQNLAWMRAALQELRDWLGHLSSSSAPTLGWGPDLGAELASLGADLDAVRARAEQTLALLTTSMALAQSSLVIDQTSGINKLTELAFVFIPISFITSVFSMQVRELTSAPPPMWTWGVALAAVAVTTYLVRCSLRSPSVRIAVLHCRATIINRFSSSKAGSASRRLNTVGNRAIAKFLFFFACVVAIIGALVLLMLLLFLVVFGGLWLGAAGTALYFIVSRWPEPAVVVPCFLSLPLAGLGMCTTWYWSDEIGDWGERVIVLSGGWIHRIFPERWTLEAADDEDLAKEGVNTYARQALILAT